MSQLLGRAPRQRMVSLSLEKRIQAALPDRYEVLSARHQPYERFDQLLSGGRCLRCGNARFSPSSRMYQAVYFLISNRGVTHEMGLMHRGCVPEARVPKL